MESFGLDFQWVTGFEGFSREINGGEGEIRTHETLLTPTRVPGVRIQPLCHLSAIIDKLNSFKGLA